MNIRLKLIFIFFFISIAPLIIVSGVYYNQSTHYLSEKVLSDLEVMAAIQQSRVQSIYGQNIERLRLITSRTQLRLSLNKLNEAAQDKSIYQQKINKIILDAQHSIDSLKLINVYSLDGVIVASTKPAFIGEQHGDEDVFLTGLKKNKANAYSHDMDGTLIAHFSGPVYFEEQLVGVLEIESSLADLMSLIKDYSLLGKTGETILAYKDAQGDAVFLTPSRFVDNTGLKKTIKKTQLNTPITHALNGENETFVDFVDFNNAPVFAVTRFIDNAQWGVVVKVNKGEVFAELTTMKYTFFLVIGLFSVILIVGIILILKNIITPITQLTLAVQKVIKGDLAVNVDESASDEMGSLAKAFNVMTSSLAEMKLNLENKEERLKVTFNSIGDAVIVTDELGNITAMNPVAEQLTAWSIQEAQGQAIKTVFPIFDATTKKPIANPIDKVLESGEVVYLSNHTTLLAKDGVEYQISDSAAPIRQVGDEAADILGMILVFQNVTEQYKLRENLRNNAAFLNNLMDVAPSVTFVYEGKTGKEFDFALSYVSEPIFEVSGEDAKQWLESATNWKEKIHPEDLPLRLQVFADAIQSKKVLDCEYRVKHQQGHYVTLREHIKAVFSDDGLVEIIANAVDISAEKTNIEQARFLGDIVERSLNEIFIFDAKTLKFIQVNSSALNNIQYSIEELKNLTPIDIKPDFSQETFAAAVAPLLSGEIERLEFETVHRRKDGTYYQVEIDLQLVTHRRQAVFVAIINDITQKKTIETELLRTNSQFKTMFEEAPLGIAIIDSLSGGIDKVNPKFVEIAGRSQQEMETIDWMSITHPDDVQEDLDNMARLNDGEFDSFNMQKRYQHPDGEYVWINMTVAKMSVEDKNKPRHLCMIQDITKQKQLENEIDSSMQHLKLYREQTPLAAIEWSTDFQVLDWNDAAEQMFGYPLKEVKGRNFVDIMLPDDAVVDVEDVSENLMAQSGGTVSVNEN
ncbi:MAG: PAS domain S-box protein, partial [Methyloprofundus sp.]|nr:PAS domain S-box protein [Methyloprofundus sp.]